MTKALIIVDPQNDFCEGGSLAVPNSNQIFDPLNKLKCSFQFEHVFITLDWHPKKHISFAQNHGLQPFSIKIINGQEYTLWPVHCLQNSKGAQVSKFLRLNGEEIYVKKGIQLDDQQYSGFGTKRYPTELKQTLKDLNVDQVYVVGLTLDFCVGSTALDAKEAGFQVTVVKECTKGVSAEGSEKMIEEFQKKGISFKSLVEIL